jgi:hypothetical protein
MNDALACVVSTSLDLHFGRLEKATPEPAAYGNLVGVVSRLVRQLSGHLLERQSDARIDADVERYIFDSNAVLPRWLVNKGLVLCQNNRANLESAVCHVLKNDFNSRRFFDYLIGELQYRCWDWSKEDAKKYWLAQMLGTLGKNAYCTQLDAYNFTLRFENHVIERATRDAAIRDWYFRSLGTATLLDCVTPRVFEATARLVDAKYKTPFIMTLFKQLFESAGQGPSPGRFAVCVLGDAPRVFGLEDYRQAAQAADPRAFPGDAGVLEVFCRVLGEFDRQCPPQCPEARFRMGEKPPQALIDRIGALFWLRRTLEAAKALQRKKAARSHGLMVEERTVLDNALKQKSILYFRLCGEDGDTTINPCQLKEIRELSMVLQSPRGNRLNESRIGREIHGYFAVTNLKRKSTYCDFRSHVMQIQAAEADYCLVELALPPTFALSWRNHRRLPLDPSQLAAFELSSPQPSANWGAFSALEHWPPPFCIIPDGASHCQIKDLSAGGLMLEIHEDAPAYAYFGNGNKEHPLLAFLHLVSQSNLPDLKLGLRLEIKSIRDFPPLHKKYVGFQFVAAGEVRQDRLVRFTSVGRDGIFLIDDWIFRNAIGR